VLKSPPVLRRDPYTFVKMEIACLIVKPISCSKIPGVLCYNQTVQMILVVRESKPLVQHMISLDSLSTRVPQIAVLVITMAYESSNETDPRLPTTTIVASDVRNHDDVLFSYLQSTTSS
jgi:hypothetical protein